MKADGKPWYVYMVRCSDRTLYCGATPDIVRRVAKHNAGRGAKYTRGRGPVELVYLSAAMTKGDALREESRVKKLSRWCKLQMEAAYNRRRTTQCRSASTSPDPTPSRTR